MMGRVSGPAQLVAALVVGIGGTLYFTGASEPAAATSTAAEVEAAFRASHAGTPDAELEAERSRLHEAIARELAQHVDARLAEGRHEPAGDATGTRWDADRVTVVREHAGGSVRVVVLEADAPEVFRKHAKHGWVGAILAQRTAGRSE